MGTWKESVGTCAMVQLGPVCSAAAFLVEMCTPSTMSICKARVR